MEGDAPQCHKAGNRHTPCSGEVRVWRRPSDGRVFLKCERHAKLADQAAERAAGRKPILRASWTDDEP